MAWMQRVRRDRGEVERWLRVREREGLSFAEISRRSGIPVGTLANWSQRLRRDDGREAATGFVEAVAIGAAGGEREGDGDLVTVRSASGARLELRGRFADRVITRLLEQLGSWC